MKTSDSVSAPGQVPSRRALIVISCLSSAWLISDVVLFLLLSESGFSDRHFYVLAAWAVLLACLWIGATPAAVAVLVISTTSLVIGFTPLYEVVFLVLVLGVAATYSPAFVRRGLLISAVVWTLAFATQVDGLDGTLLVSGTVIFAMVIVYLIGRSFRRVREKQERATLEIERAERQRRESLSEERQRLAAELHDVVAHEVTVIAMRAEAAAIVGDDELKDAALHEIRTASRSALMELRRTVDVLRDQGAVANQTLESESALFPEGVEHLVQKLESSGVPAEADIKADWSLVPRSSRVQMGRVMQECVTNVMKYGSPDAGVVVPECWIEAGRDVDGHYLMIRNRIPASGALHRHPAYSAGAGLELVESRVTALGGSFSAGPSGEDSWVCEVRGL